VLDAGAGPLTMLGKVLDSHELEIVPVDPLAAAYRVLLEEHHVVPPVPTIYGHAENLLAAFTENSFDLVYARNSIDHSFDPVRAIRQMLAVARPACFVFLTHARNEGLRMGYQGLHQWNFDLEGGHLILWNPKRRVDLTREFHDLAEMHGSLHEGWVNVRLRKR